MDWIFFDADGTLANSARQTADAYRYSFERHMVPFDETALDPARFANQTRYLLSVILPDAQIEFDKNGKPILSPSQELQIGKVRETFKRKYSSERIDLFPGIPRMIHYLKEAGYQLGIMTSNTERLIQRYLSVPLYYPGDETKEPAAGATRPLLTTQFSISSCTGSGIGKEYRLDQVLRAHDISPEDVIMVGDTQRDIDAAEHAGATFIGVGYGWELRPDHPKYYAHATVQALQDHLLALRHFR